MPTSRVVTKNGAAYLEVNGEIVPGAAYITYFSDNNRYGDFAKAGYKLYSVSVFLGQNYINNRSALECFTPGVFGDGAADFSRFDLDIRRILEVCPDAMIFPRVNVNPSREWERMHPEELTEAGPSTRHPDGKRACIGSDMWLEWVREHIRLFIEHVKESDFCDNIIGYQLAGGQTEEWFAYDENAYIGKRSREKYENYIRQSGKEDTEPELYAFHARLTAERICDLCGYVKELTEGKLAVGAFYGYTLELVSRTAAHHALGLMLSRPEVDFICSPISYVGLRNRGLDHTYMVPVDSHKLHGKLYFLECDSRTHLSKPPFDHPRFDNPVWYGFDREITINSLLMHFSKCLLHGHAFWWFDMWGGWFADKDYMEFMAWAREFAQECVGMPMKSLAEVAVFVDENAYFKMEDPGVSDEVVRKSRLTLGQMGVPYDVYLASDFDLVKDNYKAYITLEPTKTELYRIIAEHAKKSGKYHLVINLDNKDVTASELREHLSSAGISVISRKDAVVLRNESLLFIYTAEEGEYTLDLPDKTRLIDARSRLPFKKSFKAKLGEAHLFKLVTA